MKPGVFILDEMEERRWTIHDLATKSGISVDRMKDIITSEVSISMDDAQGLARAFGTSAQLWVNLADAAKRKESRHE
jgi:HTH-type transcriptional regulator/antitoxin HigA